MSIHGALQRAHDAGLLDYVPVEESDPVERVFMYGQEIRALFAEPFIGTDGLAREKRSKRLLADLQSFVREEHVSLCFRDHEHNDATFGRLESPGMLIWDFRSRDPRPSLRLLGAFAAPNVFVALNWWPRWKKVPWSDKEPLLRNDQRWADAISDAEQRWRDILLGKQPVSGDDVRKYVTANFSIV